MIDPTLSAQTAIRAALVASPAVSELVPAQHIRAGAIRPDRMPAIILESTRLEYLGAASGGQRLARVMVNLHLWAQEDGHDTARKIGAAVLAALENGPNDTAEIAFDEWRRPAVVWLRDPQPNMANTHGVMALEAVVRWRV